MRIEALPPEVLAVVGEWCGQADCLSLAVAYPPFEPTLSAQLYHSIVFDTGPRPLHRERERSPVISDGTVETAVTVVRTIGGIRQCLATLGRRPDLAAHVWRLEIRARIPLGRATLVPELTEAAVNLENLTALVWRAAPALPLSVLSALPNASRLEQLDVFIDVHRWTRPYELPPLSVKNLRIFDVRPIPNESVLNWTARSTAEAPLEDVGLCTAAPDVDPGPIQDMPLTAFFRGRRNVALRRLELRGVTMGASTSSDLAGVDVSNLHELVLEGEGSLNSLGRLPLWHLRLVWDNGVPEFIERLSPGLTSLEIAAPSAAFVRMIPYIAPHLTHLAITQVRGGLELADLAGIGNLQELESIELPFSFSFPSWRMITKLPLLRKLSLWNSGPSSHGGLVSTGFFSGWVDSERPPLVYAPVVAAAVAHGGVQRLEIDGREVMLAELV